MIDQVRDATSREAKGSLALLVSAYRNAPPILKLAAAFVVTLVVVAFLSALDSRSLAGDNVWLKPARFSLAFAVHLATVAAAMTLLPPDVRRRRMVRGSVVAIMLITTLELLYIVIRAARGEGSHFNVATPLATTLYHTMGAAALMLVGATGVIGWYVLRAGSEATPSVVRVSVGVGFMMGAILGGYTGLVMAGLMSHGVRIPSPVADRLPLLHWSLVGGDLRAPHFLAVHTMQAIPAVGLLSTRLSRSVGMLVVFLATIAWFGLFVVVFLRTMRGESFFPTEFLSPWSGS